jgi:sugar phosphate isomerase/epimerase
VKLRGKNGMRVSHLDNTVWTRRDFCFSIAAGFASQMVKVKEAGPPGTFGIASGSFQIRERQIAQAAGSEANAAIGAEKFIDLCKSFGGDGCQMDLAQLASKESAYLKRVRQALEDKGMFLELSLDAQQFEDLSLVSSAAATAKDLGITRLRLALTGRRTEDFTDLVQWQEFSDRWLKRLQQAEPIFRESKLHLGVENHRDWLADELVAVLRTISSPHVGACVDFANNLTLLEDPVEVVQKLAPYAVTSHLRDAAVVETEEGFLLADVPLGQGILPLAKLMELLRRSRSDIHFCLEMITRDPVKVSYLDDSFWVAFGKRDSSRIDRFKTAILSKATSKRFPKISSMTSAQMLAVEDDNVRHSVAYAKRTLGL